MQPDDLRCLHEPVKGEGIKDESRICKAIDWIAYDLTRPENMSAWEYFFTRSDEQYEPEHLLLHTAERQYSPHA